MTAHFKMEEFSSPTVGANGKANYRVRRKVPAKYSQAVTTLMKELEIIRAKLGGKSVRIASGWRDKAFNGLNAGRASRSKHLYGQAADIQVKGLKPNRVYWVISDLITAGLVLPGGLACYSTFVHYDTRGRYPNGRMARWKPSPKRPARGPGSKYWMADL